MTFPSMLYSFFLMPIQLVFEVVFNNAYIFTGYQAGLAIIALSLAINFLVLPLYRRADAMQEEERLMETKLHDGVAHIKKSFRGDERTMILQTYYRQNNYSPLYVMRSAVSLFLEIPFFIAAYRFLSGLELLKKVPFGPIADLGKPDGLIVIGGLAINLLPVLMTAVNIVSTAIFTKGYPLKTKIQLYGMAAFFLVFLYDSPSGLVFYWTLNNVFSLVKTIFYKIKNPQKVLRIMALIAGICFVVFGIYNSVLAAVKGSPTSAFVAHIVLGVLLCLPFVFTLIKTKAKIKFPEVKAAPNKKLFWSGAIFLTVMTGVLIPSAVITASPQEFIIIGNSLHPVWFVVSTALIASGTFILWLSVFYWLFAPKIKVIIERVVLVFCGVGVVNYLFFGRNFGVMSSELVYANGIQYNVLDIIINSLVVIAVAAALLLITNKKVKIITGVFAAASLTMLCMSCINVAGIYKSVAQIDMKSITFTENKPKLTLSKNGKNVVVLMLDRAMGEYVPFIMDEHPELKEKFSGFTYYNNVISFGGHTNFAAPALFGGYEYTPVELNKRNKESLQEKNDEALKVMPAMFDENGFNVTVCDPPYAGYKEIPDLSIYDDYPNIDRYITQGMVTTAKPDEIISCRYRNFFCFSLMKAVPAGLQYSLYDSGDYHQVTNMIDPAFTKSYDVLKALPKITNIKDDSKGSFVMMNNETTHSFIQFEDKDCLIPKQKKDYKLSQDSKFSGNVRLDFNRKMQISTYETNTAALMRVGDWMDYLKKQGVYDNTRIIIVSDHGYPLLQNNALFIDNTAFDPDIEVRYGDAELYYPLMMVKDFNSKEFTVSSEFMTNADVPTLAAADVIESPKNPFTKKDINNDEKTAHDQYIIASEYWVVSNNNGNTYFPAKWYSVHDSIWDRSNWKLVAKDKTLP